MIERRRIPRSNLFARSRLSRIARRSAAYFSFSSPASGTCVKSESPKKVARSANTRRIASTTKCTDCASSHDFSLYGSKIFSASRIAIPPELGGGLLMIVHFAPRAVYVPSSGSRRCTLYFARSCIVIKPPCCAICEVKSCAVFPA